MKRLVHLLSAFAVFVLAGAPAAATTITIDEATDSFSVGGFYLVAGNNTASSPGQVFDLLQLQDNGTESGSNDLDMGDIWSYLDAAGFTDVQKLVIGLGINETAPVGDPDTVDVTDLQMVFEMPSGPDMTFSLGSGNNIVVWNYHQGASTAEVRIGVDFGPGFNFMTAFDASSTEQFSIASTIGLTSDGFELFFIDSAYASGGGGGGGLNPVPEPASLVLLGTGFGLIAHTVRRKRQPKN